MSPGLVYLLRAAPRGFLRGITRRLGGIQGSVALVAGGGLLLILAGAQIMMFLAERRADADPDLLRARLETVRAVAPLALTGFLLLLDLSGKGLFFRPAEIDFLMPAPISRRELLIYHLISRGSVQVLSGLWLALFTLRWGGSLFAALTATVLAMVFLHLAAEVWSLLVAAAGERWGTKVRVGLWSVVIGAIILGVRTSAAAAGPGAGIAEILAAGATSPAVRLATLPARPFAEAFASESFLEALPWLAACVAEMGAAVIAVLRLDIAFEEAALASSRKLQDRLRSMRSGEGAFVASQSSLSRRLPRFPRWGGIGPIAHRQCTELVRNPGSVLWSAGGMIFIVALVLWIPTFTADPVSDEGPKDLGIAALVMTLALTSFMNQGFPYDFRRDLDRMSVLKSLPVRPWIVAAGQLVTPAVIFTLTQWSLFALIAARSEVPGHLLAVCAAVALPWNWFSTSLDDAMFLLLPYRIDPEDPANMPFLGRLAAVMAVKGIAMGITAIPLVACIAGGMALGGASGVLLFVLAVLLASAAAVAGTFACAVAFRNFDVTRDV